MPVSMSPGHIELTRISVLWSWYALVLAIEFTLQSVQLRDTAEFLSEIALTQPCLRYLFVAVKLRKPCEYRTELLTIDSPCSRLQSGHCTGTMSKGGIIREIATLPDAVKIILPPLNSFPLDGLVTFIAADACRMARNTLESSGYQTSF